MVQLFLDGEPKLAYKGTKEAGGVAMMKYYKFYNKLLHNSVINVC